MAYRLPAALIRTATWDDMSKLTASLTIIASSIFWLLVLPFYFNGGYTLECVNHTVSCTGHSMTKVSTGTWHMFGGFHIFIEQFLPMTQLRHNSYEASYNYSSDWLVLLLIATAVLLGYGSCIALRKIHIGKTV
jgi:hypothetical protein